MTALGAAAAFGFAVVIWHLPGLSDLGLTWDEPIYLRAAERIQTWAGEIMAGPSMGRALSAHVIRDVFDWMHYWNPHPPVFREAMAVTEALAGDHLGSLSGFRLASLLWFGLATATVVYVGSRAWGLVAGVAAGLALILMPRLVGHAHIAATDMPLTATWLLGTLGLALYAERGSLRWGVLGSVGFGLAMATKFTGYLLPLPLAAWILWRRPEWRRIAGVAALLGVSLAVAWAVNPMAWHEPVGYVVGLVRESLSRDEIVPISTFYLGVQHGYEVPWHHPLVMTLATVPLPLLALAGWGAAAGLGEDDTGGMVDLCLVQIAFFLLLLALPTSPNHDGVRLFLPMFPFVAMLAGRGFTAAVASVDVPGRGRQAILAAMLLGAVFFYPPYVQTVNAAPHYLSYYGEAIGGARGAEARGMEATYWYDALTPRFLDEVNDVLPRDARLITLPRQGHFRTLQNFGLLRQDLDIVGPGKEAPFVLLYARKSLMQPVAWRLYREVTPVRSVTYQGVELAGLYVRSEEAFE